VSGGPILAARDLHVGYRDALVLHGIDLEVRAGEVVALFGPNGAGKSTTLLTLAGELTPAQGEVTWKGEVGSGAPLNKRARDGLSFVTEERSVFTRLSAADNLRVGGADTARALELFPELRPLLRRRAGLLSGGEQQILTLARALARAPQVLLADELSLGLAPLVVDRLLAAVRQAADRGVGVLLVEQHVEKALAVADRVYVLRQGRIEFSGSAEEARRDLDAIAASYLGMSTSTT
jgi:ABC-type branched-subunit amino acid transport system ATPase component